MRREHVLKHMGLSREHIIFIPGLSKYRIIGSSNMCARLCYVMFLFTIFVWACLRIF